jgi:hypothetical protein
MAVAFGVMAVLAAAGVIGALLLWPASDPGILPHRHDDLPPGHPHLRDAHPDGRAEHPFVIDDLHRHWPAQ